MDLRGRRSCRDQSVVETRHTLLSYSYSLPPPEGRGNPVVAAALLRSAQLGRSLLLSPLMTNNRVAVLAVSVVRDVSLPGHNSLYVYLLLFSRHLLALCAKASAESFTIWFVSGPFAFC